VVMNNNTDLYQLCEFASNYCVGMEGNVSKKQSDIFFIKSSGSKLKNITDSDIVSYDFNGNQLDNFNKKGSMEINFHKFFLSFDEINFVCHTHPINTLKILCTHLIEKFSECRLFPDQVIFNGKKTLVIPYKTPGEELFNEIKNKVNNELHLTKTLPKLILLENHGIITCGKTIDECMVLTEICEKSAEIFLSTYDKNPKYLNDNDINILIKDNNEKYRLEQL
jgi:L-fuculose-phosphate aldolase